MSAPQPPASDVALAPVVATTVNPFGDVAHQRRCFEAWRKLGCTPLTANTAQEGSSLVATGFDAADILSIAPEDTGLALFGKGIPRVRPVLSRLAEAYPDRPVILVNADIFPAVRHREVLRFWFAEAPALALTREDCALLEAHTLLDGRPYRNGLDAFLFRPGILKEALEILAAHAVSERMCFGIPGWDFFLGALVRSPAIGGRIMDGTVLLHETHRQTYANVDEFAHYIPAMEALGERAGADAAEAAYAFHQRILADCAASARQSAFVRAISYARPAPPAPPGPEALQIAAETAALAPFVRWNYDFAAMAALAERVRAGAPFERVRHFFRTPSGPEHGFVEALLAARFALACRDPAVPLEDLSPDAPPPKGLAAHLRETARDKLAQRERMAILFGELLVEEHRFSPLLFDYLALSCASDPARTILADTLALARPEKDPADLR